MEDREDRPDRRKLIRFTLTERLFHWAYALPFMALLVSGVLHRLHVLGWEGWGHRTWLEGVHRGAALALILAPAIVLLWGDREALQRSFRELAHWRKADFRWLVLFFLGPFRGRRPLPPVGRFNAGQKLNALAACCFALALAVSGLLLWVQKGSGVLLAALVHQLLVPLFLPFLLGHLFLALIHPRTRRALPGMIRGEVDADWAREHHPGWYEGVAWEGHPGISFGGRVGLRPHHLLDLLQEADRCRVHEGEANEALILPLGGLPSTLNQGRLKERTVRRVVLTGGARILLEGSFPLVTAWSGKRLAGIGWAMTDMAFHAFICDVLVRRDGPGAELVGEILHRLKGSLEGRGVPLFALPEDPADHGEREEKEMSCRGYFAEFLPQTIGKSLVAKIESLNIVLSFSLEGEGGGDWTLMLEGGKLVEIKEGKDERAEIVYRMGGPTFLAVVSGRLNPQKAFFSGKVKIGGNTLKALKMAVIFQGFFREYPYVGEGLGVQG